MVVSGVLRGDGGGQGDAKALLLFRIVVEESNESQEYSLLQYMEETRSIYLVDETLGCTYVSCSSD